MPDAPPPESSTNQPSQTVAGPDASAAGGRARVWPGVLAVLLMWAALILPPRLFPESPRGFMPLYFGLMGSYALVVLWWLFASRTPWGQRLAGFAVAVGGLLVGAGFLYHGSMRGGAAFLPMMFFIGPYVATALVGGLLVTGWRGWATQRWVALGVLIAGLGAPAMLRYEGVDSAFNATFLPRWRLNAEERLLASRGAERLAPGDAPGSAEVTADDWPGFRGAARNGHVLDNALAADWESDPPQELWRQEIGPGWSSFCVVGETAFTQEQRGERECVVAYDAATGRERWATGVEARFEESVAGPGPRATPTFFEGNLFVTGAAGAVQKIDASSGEILWKRLLVGDQDAGVAGDTLLESPPQWGFASSPLVVTLDSGQSLAIVYAGNLKAAPDEPAAYEAVIAYDAETGEPAWKAGAGYHGYSSPHLANFSGVPQVLVSTNEGLESFDPATGERLWLFDWSIDDFPRSLQPLIVDQERLVLSAGYDSGTMLVKVTLDGGEWSVEEQWDQPSRDLEPYFNDIVLHEGHLYGIHKKFLVSIDLESGGPTWPRRVKRRAKFGNGQLVLDAGAGLLLVTDETTGEVLLVEANPETLVVRGRFQALAPATNWNHPVVAGGRLFVRNGGEAACFRLPEASVAQR